MFFFFQAEDGIRDTSVTGVQSVLFRSQDPLRVPRRPVVELELAVEAAEARIAAAGVELEVDLVLAAGGEPAAAARVPARSEERRVGHMVRSWRGGPTGEQ